MQTLEVCLRAPASRRALSTVADGAAIPQMLTSIQWSRPNTELLLKLRRARVRLVWGNNRGTRCPEVVMAILANPVRSDPIGVIFGARLCKLRTRLRDSIDGYEEFRRQFSIHQETVRSNKRIKLKQVQGPAIRTVDGPISGAVGAAEWSPTTISVENEEVSFRTREGFRIKLMDNHHSNFKRQVTELVRQAILHRL